MMRDRLAFCLMQKHFDLRLGAHMSIAKVVLYIDAERQVFLCFIEEREESPSLGAIVDVIKTGIVR